MGFKNKLHAGANSEIFGNAKQLRTNQTEAEKVMWQQLRGRRFENLKFRRQHPIHEFIADFYCHEKQLIIEIDGQYHKRPDQQKKDQARTAELNKIGIIVVRFTNERVLNDLDGCLKELKSKLQEITSP